MTVDDSHESQEAVSQHMKTRKLKLNLGKTEIKLVRTALRRNLFNEPSSFSLSGAEIPISEKVPSLAVVIDSNLSLRNQIAEVKGTVVNLMSIS